MADMEKEFQKLGSEAFSAATQFLGFFSLKRVLTLLIVGLALIAVCSPHDAPSPTGDQPLDCGEACPLPEAPPPPPIHTENQGQEDWSFTLVGSSWVRKDLPSEEIKLAMENRNFMCLVFVVKEPTTDSFGRYVASTIRGFSETGALIDSVKMVNLNKQKFVLAQLNKDDEVVWVWMAVRNGFGYGFTCGCEINPDAGAAQRDLCQHMADTFVIQ